MSGSFIAISRGLYPEKAVKKLGQSKDGGESRLFRARVGGVVPLGSHPGAVA